MSCKTYDPCLNGKLNQIGSYASVARQSAEASQASATQSAASASASAASAASAAESAAEAAASAEIAGVYLGAFAVPPVPPIEEGALYFNTVDNTMYVWNGTSWITATGFNETTNFLATGTTTARDLQERFADVLNVKDFGAVGDGVADDAQAFTNANNSWNMVYIPDGIYKCNSSPIVNNASWFISPGAKFTGSGRPTFYRGFWTNIGDGANIFRFPDRTFVGGASSQNGEKTVADLIADGATTWVTRTSYMGYFDTRSQFASYSTIGKIGGAFATKTSDDNQVSERGAIGVASFALNDKNDAVEKKTTWNYYGHNVSMNTNNYYTVGMELDVFNLSNSTVVNNPYLLNDVNSSGVIAIGAGGETAQYIKDTGSFTANGQTKTDSDIEPISYGICFISNGSVSSLEEPTYPGLYQRNRFYKGIIFSSRSLYRPSQPDGTTTETSPAIAIEMASGHQLVWKYASGSRSNSGIIRSDGNNAEAQQRIVFETGAFRVKGVKSDLITETNLFSVTSPILIAGQTTNSLVIQPKATNGGGYGNTEIIATGDDNNIDISITPKGTGLVKNGTHVAITTETVTGFIQIKDAAGNIRKLAVVS